jgi:hypothetical protein
VDRDAFDPGPYAGERSPRPLGSAAANRTTGAPRGAGASPSRHEAVLNRAPTLAHHGRVLKSAYKGERLGKTPACILCGGPGQGRRAPLQLPFGVTVWLCAGHRDPEFLARRAGRDLVTSLMHVWQSAGCLDRRRHEALGAHLRRVQDAGALQGLPGSYAWPALRAEAERRFAPASRSPR